MTPIRPRQDRADEFIFHCTRMRIHLRTPQTGGAYGLIEMWHPPAVGPALHVHPRGPESFLVLQGTYTFTGSSGPIDNRAPGG